MLNSASEDGDEVDADDVPGLKDRIADDNVE